MAKSPTEVKHRVSGDWTISGVESQFGSLNETLQELAADHCKAMQVDCAGIDAIDMSGLQLLHLWMEYAKAQGVGVQLVNLPDCMQQTVHQLGLGPCFSGNSPVGR